MIDLMEEKAYWHVVYTASRAEKKVEERLLKSGVECYLAVRTVVRQWTHRKSKVVVPVIARMIFVRVGRSEQVKVLEIQGVVSFLKVRGESRPAIIPDRQLESFRFLLDLAPESFEISNEHLAVGDFVEVVKGPLMGLKGELLRLRGETKVAVRIECLGCALVDIPASYVERIGAEFIE